LPHSHVESASRLPAGYHPDEEFVRARVKAGLFGSQDNIPSFDFQPAALLFDGPDLLFDFRSTEPCCFQMLPIMVYLIAAALHGRGL
jgi:hypothetical protein